MVSEQCLQAPIKGYRRGGEKGEEEETQLEKDGNDGGSVEGAVKR